MYFLVLASLSAIILSARGHCDRSGASDSFILSTHTRPFSTPYDVTRGSTLLECTRQCLASDLCRSLTFVRSQNDSTCNLLDVTSTTVQSAVPHGTNVLEPNHGNYYFEKMCMKGACDRLFVAESLQGMELEGHDDKIISNSSRQSCLESCLQSKELLCRSVEYDAKSGECKLSRHDRFNRNIHFKKSSASVEYFDVTCSYQLPAETAENTNSAEIVLLGNVEHPYSLLEFYGVSPGECGELCIRNVLFPCRSFLSGRLEDQQLYCGLTHQNRDGLLQNPTGLHASRSLNYYEVATNLEACDINDLHFELITGTVLNVNPYTVTSDLTPDQCLDLCKKEARCRSVGVDYRKGSCQYNSESIGHTLDPKLQKNGNFNYFEKICLPAGSDCKRDWAFERTRGKELVGIQHEKVSLEANTKEECQAACLSYKDFPCRSAEFNYELNECKLSPYNRFSSTEKGVTLTHSRVVVDYFENNCITEARGFCNTRLIKKLKLLLPERTTSGDTMEECQRHCYNNEAFVCRSVTFDSRFRTCGLSHHTRKSAPQESIARSENNEFLEISTCFHAGGKAFQHLGPAALTLASIVFASLLRV